MPILRKNISYFIFIFFTLFAVAGVEKNAGAAESAAANHIYVVVDPHGDPKGQLELARLLLSLAHKNDLRLVGLEAATGDASLSFLRDSAPIDWRFNIANRYLKTCYLHGSELATLMPGGDFELWGVENPALYDRTIQLYRRIAFLRAEAFRRLAAARETLSLAENTVSNPGSGRRYRGIREWVNLSDSFLRGPWHYFQSDAFLNAMNRRYYARLTRSVNQILRDQFPNRTDLLMTGRAMQDLVAALRESEELYRQRNAEFVSRILEEMNRRSVNRAALVIGAIHVPQTVRLLEERGVACTVVQPPTSIRVNAYRYERLLIRQPLIHDSLSAVSASIPRLSLRFPQATLLRPMIAQIPAELRLGREPILNRFAQALGPKAVLAVQARVKEGIGEGLVSDSLEDSVPTPGGHTAAEADATGYIAFKTHVRELEQLKDLGVDPRSLPKAVYRSLRQYAASLRLAAQLHQPEISQSAAGTLPGKPDTRLDRDGWARAKKFLLHNTTSSGLPLSYRAPKDFWKDPSHDLSDIVDGVIERQIVANSVNIYDGAVWQIALQLDGGKQERYLADDFTRRLLRGRSGTIKEIRAWEPPFFYGDDKIKLRRDNSYIFRIIADRWFQEDPKDGKQFLPGFPNAERLHHEDWKPITGEQAWAAIIGPIQSAYIKYKGRVPADSKEAQIGFNLLPAVQAMQSPIGAIYHAPWGTYGKDPRDISNENNFSMLAALRMLYRVALDNGNWHEATRIQWLIRGIEAYFREYAFDADSGVFYQGGFFMEGEFVPNPVFAVDCQTWGICVLGPEWIDRTYGKGTAYRIWQNTKARSGVYDRDGRIEGVGFTDSRDVVSVEWSAGAVLCTKILSEYYREARPEWSKALLNESRSMRAAMEKYKVRLPDGSDAYFYANRRFFIPFGWWANPFPSLVSTSWILLLDKDFNPFVLGGKSVPMSIKADSASSDPDADNLPQNSGAAVSAPASADPCLLLNAFLPSTHIFSQARSAQLRCRGNVNPDLPAELVVKDENGADVFRTTFHWSPRGKNMESPPLSEFGVSRRICTSNNRYQLLLYAAPKHPEKNPRIFWQLRIDADQTPRA